MVGPRYLQFARSGNMYGMSHPGEGSGDRAIAVLGWTGRHESEDRARSAGLDWPLSPGPDSAFPGSTHASIANITWNETVSPTRVQVPVAHTKAERKEGHVTMEDMKKELW